MCEREWERRNEPHFYSAPSDARRETRKAAALWVTHRRRRRRRLLLMTRHERRRRRRPHVESSLKFPAQFRKQESTARHTGGDSARAARCLARCPFSPRPACFRLGSPGPRCRTVRSFQKEPCGGARTHLPQGEDWKPETSDFGNTFHTARCEQRQQE